MTPLSRVEDGSLESVDASDVGQRRLAERSGTEHHDVGSDHALVGRYLPPSIALVPPKAGHVVPEPDESLHVVGGGAGADVLLDLGLGSERPGPVGIGREREGVEDRGDIALAARVGVHVPGASEVVLALDDHEVLDGTLAEPDGHADAGQPGSEDDHAVMIRLQIVSVIHGY